MLSGPPSSLNSRCGPSGAALPEHAAYRAALDLGELPGLADQRLDVLSLYVRSFA